MHRLSEHSLLHVFPRLDMGESDFLSFSEIHRTDLLTS